MNDWIVLLHLKSGWRIFYKAPGHCTAQAYEAPRFCETGANHVACFAAKQEGVRSASPVNVKTDPYALSLAYWNQQILSDRRLRKGGAEINEDAVELANRSTGQ